MVGVYVLYLWEQQMHQLWPLLYSVLVSSWQPSQPGTGEDARVNLGKLRQSMPPILSPQSLPPAHSPAHLPICNK